MDFGQPNRPVAPRRAKACPQCHAMTFADAPTCPQCGHRFSTGLDAAQLAVLHEPLTEENIHRTQMLTLPPLALHPQLNAQRETAVVTEVEVAAGMRKLNVRERLHRCLAVAAYVIVVLLMGGLWWWLQGHL